MKTQVGISTRNMGIQSTPELVRHCAVEAERAGGHNRKSKSTRKSPVMTVRRCKANWARLIQKVYEVDPLECPNYGAAMRIIALIDDSAVIERILRQLNVWDPRLRSL